MKIFIPDIGTNLTLKENWEFILYHEEKNANLFDKLGLGEVELYWEWEKNKKPPSHPLVILPKTTILTVERVYIKKNKSDYSSIAFKILDSPNKVLKKLHFFAKLKDVNNMIIEDK